jgi:hypothetical protein
MSDVLAIGPCLRSAGAARQLARRLAMQGLLLVQAANAVEAEKALLTSSPRVIVIDLDMPCGTPLVLMDLATWRHPDARLIFTGSGVLCADGAAFAHAPNLSALLPPGLDDDDLIEVIAFHAGMMIMDDARPFEAAYG